MDAMRGAAKALVTNVAQIVDTLAFCAFHMACGAKEFAESGFAIPEVVTAAASLSIMACSIGGHASLAMDLVSKVYGKVDCATCNGWEGLRCTACRGTGRVQYLLANTGGEENSATNAARSVLEGRAELKQAPSSLNVGYTLPTKECTMCSGTGVMKCTECDGFAWQDCVHIEEIANLPTRAVNAYKKLEVPNEYILDSLEDPATAEYLLFTRPELEMGRLIDEESKKEMWSDYEDWRSQRIARDLILNKAPGWETAQQVLVATDPTETLEDPLIVKNVPYYKARKIVEAEVNRMEIPPRPADWGTASYPLKASDWSEVDLKDPKKREERDVLLRAQSSWINGLLDTSWENHWRKQKVMELTQRKIQDFVKSQGASELKAAAAKAEATAAASKQTAEKQRSGSKVRQQQQQQQQQQQMSKEEVKKKERKERAEKMARQAAEREAALKKARESKR